MKDSKIKTATELLTYSKEGQYDNQYLDIPLKNKKGEVVGYSVERNKEWKSGLYIEHGMLEETTLLEVQELDIEGKSSIGGLGIYHVEPNYFTVELMTTFIGDLTYYDYTLNTYGWEQLEAQGLKHPGRGFVSYELITKSDLAKKIKNITNTILGLQNEFNSYSQLLANEI